MSPARECSANAIEATIRSTGRRALLLLSAAAAIGCSTRDGPAWKHLYVWAGPGMTAAGAPRADDFIAVINADPHDSSYGRVIASTDAGFPGRMAHHVEFKLPLGHPLFANDFMTEQVVLIDFTNPLQPRVVHRIDSVPGFEAPHSFVRLANGNVIASLQFGGDSLDGYPGGIAEFDTAGKLLRTASAADSAFPRAHIRVYGLELLPAIDRAVTTSAPMSGERTADVVQVWSLSGLHLLKTIPIQGNGDSVEHHPFEVRALPGGRTALMNTYYCGFYLLTGLETDQPKASLVYSLNLPHRRRGCSVPVIVGHYWVMPVAYGHSIVVLNISDPAHPVEASVLHTDSTFFPHWSSADPSSDRIVFTEQGDGDPRVMIGRLDQRTGTLTWDDRFHDPGTSRPGVSFARTSWPHGQVTSAVPHGALFGP